MRSAVIFSLFIFVYFGTQAQSMLKFQYKTALLLNDSNMYVIPDASDIKAINYGGKEIAYHSFFKNTHQLHATFIKKDDYYIFEEYNTAGNIIAKGKFIQNVLYCKKDTQNIFSPITLKEIEKHITCYYNLVKVGIWEYNTLRNEKIIGNYFNGKKDGIWKSYINDSYLSNIKTYKLDVVLKDSSIHQISNYNKDSLKSLLDGVWYATTINKADSTYILQRDSKDFSFEYSIKIMNDQLFERNAKFIIENSPLNSLKGNWKWNDDNTLSLSTSNQNIIIQFLYIDKKEIIIKEIHQQKI